MSQPPRTWNEAFEEDAERRRNRRDDEQRWERERDPQRFGRQSLGRPQRDDDHDFESQGRSAGRERWESFEEWQQPRRMSGYYENHRFGGEPQRFGHESPGAYGHGYGSEDRGFAGLGPKNYKRSDQRIQEDICERLTADPRVDASEIEVEVKNGEVTLEGSVREREMKRRAEDCAEYVSGVSEVHNRLRVAPSQTGRAGQSSQQGQSGSETWARAGSEQRADQPGTSLPGRSGRIA